MIIDVSTAVGPWPFMELNDSPEDLSLNMQKKEINIALVSPNEGVCYKNPHLVNEKHIERLKPFPHLIPVSVINPLLNDMEKEIKKASEHDLPAVKIFPNYHGYSPDSQEVLEMLKLCASYELTVIVQLRVSDDRGHHPVMMVHDVDLEKVLDIIEKVEELPVVICGKRHYGGFEERIISRPQTYIDTSFMEILLDQKLTLEQERCNLNNNYDRILFGSHYPFFYIESNLIKLDAVKEEEDIYRRITELNALEAFKGLKGI